MDTFNNDLVCHLLTFWASVQFMLILLRISETIKWKWWLVLLPILGIIGIAAVIFLAIHYVECASHERIFHRQ